MLRTGVPGLDTVLGGGIPRGDLLFVVGAPGCGKTTLVAQTAFHAAGNGERVMLASSLSEPAARLVKHLRGFSFWDDQAVSRAISFESVFPVAREGAEALVGALVQRVQARSASVLVLDGYCTLRDLQADPPERRAFISELAAGLDALGCTTLITSSHSPPEQGAASPEFTMCDGIVQLSEQDSMGRSQRTLRVRKSRGVASLLGAHTLRIAGDGLTVYPRIETYTSSRDVALPPERLSLGCPQLDGLMSGGLPRGSSTVVAGAPGTGKTVLALQYLIEGARRGEPGILVGFRETPAQLVAKARSLGLDLETPLSDGGLRVLRQPAIDLEPDEVLAKLLRELEQSGATRLAFDGIVELERTFAEGRKRQALTAMVENLRTRGVTTLHVHELGPSAGAELDLASSPLQVLAENVLLLRYLEVEGKLIRAISILKMRDAAHAHVARHYELGSAGLRVLGHDESATALTGGRSPALHEPASIRGSAGSTEAP